MSHHVKDQEDLDAKLESAGDKLVVIDFFALWCGPCKLIAPKLEECANKFGDKIVVLKVDIDECEDIAVKYNISSMPTFVFIKKGEQLDCFSGGNPEKLEQFIVQYSA